MPDPTGLPALRAEIAEALRQPFRRACAEADGFDIERLEPHDYQRHADSLLNAVLPVLARLAQQRDRYRAAWRSARRRAAANGLYGSREPGGAVREALVLAGLITRRDTVASAVKKIDAAPRAWYVRWLENQVWYFARAKDHAVAQAKAQARRADRAEAERDAARADAEQLRAECERQADEIQGAQEANADWAKRARAAEAKVHAIEAIRCWTNEDGKGFPFADDVRAALGYTPNEMKETPK